MSKKKTKKEKMLGVIEDIIAKTKGKKRVADGDLFEWYRQRMEILLDIQILIRASKEIK